MVNAHGAEFVQALLSRYAADILECKATIRVYLERPVGIGEHPQHIEEIDRLVEKMTNSRDKMDMLKKTFPDYAG